MNLKYILGGSAAALAVAGVGLNLERAGHDAGAPFLSPLDIVRSACGKSADAAQKRRAYFVGMARAWADAPAGDPAGARLTPVDTIGYKVTATAPAQMLFDAALAHSWNFNHGAAIEVFKRAQEADPDCAMCHWGEAFAYGPNINAPMADEAYGPAHAAVQKAVALKDKASEKERALIDALALRYQADPLKDRSALDAAFADAMDAITLQYPDDNFIAALAAEANMDTQPWDYWEPDGRTPKGRTARTISLIEGVLARDPNYVAAIHLYIHITEATDNPYRAVEYADRLDDLSPGLGHLIHMPSHTWYRIGRFKQSIAENKKAVAADEAFIAAGDAPLLYEFGYYVHNVHFVMMSSLMAGDSETALAMAEKLDAKLPAEMAVAVPFAQPIKAAPYYVQGRFGDPDKVLALPKPEGAPFLEASWRYARGEALARKGDAAGARAEAEAISAIMTTADLSGLTDVFIPAPEILRMQWLTVTARAAAADGDLDSAVEAMAEAAALQENIPYTEPPYWYYPAKQTLAAMLIEKGEAERAEHLLLEALADSPNNGWVFYGLGRAYAAQGDKAAAKFADGMMKDAWLGKSKPTLGAL